MKVSREVSFSWHGDVDFFSPTRHAKRPRRDQIRFECGWSAMARSDYLKLPVKENAAQK